MVISDIKIVQALIQAANNAIDAVVAANTTMQSDKSDYDGLSPSLTSSNLTSQQLTDLETWISDLNTLATAAIVATVQGKDVPSHGKNSLG